MKTDRGEGDPVRVRRASAEKGHSRLDLAATLAAVMLLAAFVFPALARTGTRSEQLQCFNNLRLIGRALHLWANDRNGLMPWRTPTSLGGTASVIPRSGNVWYEFLPISNELATPRILVCPSDREARMATEFSRDPDGGFMHYSFRARAVSYFIGLDTHTEIGASLLSGDRNLKVDNTGVNCSSGVNNASEIRIGPIPPYVAAAWTNAIHGPQGNVLRSDGRVSSTSSATLAAEILIPADDNGSVHILLPR